MSGGTGRSTAYTPSGMETGALGESREILLDALYAEAKQVLGQSTNQLRSIQERLREAHGSDLQVWQHLNSNGPEASSTSASLARGGQLLTRLELAVRDLEQVWLFMERGGTVERETHGRPEVDGAPLDGSILQLVARNVLEAQEAERTRIAEELHDGPAQALANASFQVEVIENSLRRDPVGATAELQSLRLLLDREMERLRGFIHQLRPVMLEDADLEMALREVAERLTAETGTEVEADFGAPQSMLGGAQRSVALRIAQEALRNVEKHAGATHVWLVTRLSTAEGSRQPNGWILEVRDDGRGFVVDEALSATGRRHFGLRFMRERARLAGATLEIESVPTVGTTIRVTLDTGEEMQL